jgi:hypothetical protein
MKSPFKFLDSYTKDDREIFFDHHSVIPKPGILLEDIIPPFQGLNGCMSVYSHRTLSNALVFCAFSAYSKFHYNMKWLYLIEQDSTLPGVNTILFRPERALYYKTGQRPVYKTYNDNKPCKGEILFIRHEIPIQIPRQLH